MLTSLSALGRLKTAHGFTLLEAMVVLVLLVFYLFLLKVRSNASVKKSNLA